MARYRILQRSHLAIEARSSVHPIRVETDALEGFFEAEIVDGKLQPGTAPQGSLEIEVESLQTGNRLYDRQIESQLEVRKFPFVRAALREVTALPDGRLLVRGDLSLHGVTKRIEGNVTLRALDDQTVVVEGEKVIDLRDFGLEPPRILMLKVYPDVTIRAHIVAQREG